MDPARDPSDPFDILGIPPGFELNPAALGRAYLALAARLHPDIARGDPDASIRSAAANRAKAILENPESRAAALLARLGGPSKESDRSLPPGFLADICAHHLIIDASERQAILETLDLNARLLRVTEALALQRLALGKHGHDLN